MEIRDRLPPTGASAEPTYISFSHSLSLPLYHPFILWPFPLPLLLHYFAFSSLFLYCSVFLTLLYMYYSLLLNSPLPLPLSPQWCSRKKIVDKLYYVAESMWTPTWPDDPIRRPHGNHQPAGLCWIDTAWPQVLWITSDHLTQLILIKGNLNAKSYNDI